MHRNIKAKIVSLLIMGTTIFPSVSSAVALRCKSFEPSASLILEKNIGDCAPYQKPYSRRNPTLFYRYIGIGPQLEVDFLSDFTLFCPGSKVEKLYGKIFVGGKAGLSMIVGLAGAGFVNSEARTCAVFKGYGIAVGGGITVGTLKFYETLREQMSDY